MAIEGDIQALLSPLVSGRCYPLVNTSTTLTRPYITFSVVSNVPVVSLTGPSGLERRRFQIDIWGDSYGAVKDIEARTKSTFSASSIVNVPLSSQDLYEEDTKLYRVSMDFAVWAS